MRNFFQSKAVNFIFLVLIATEIFYVSSLSFGQGSKSFQIVPIAYHLIVFFLFSFFTFNLICSKKIKTLEIMFSLTLSIIFAILDEIHQIFVPFRGAGLEDVLINSIGIFSATILFLISKNYYKLLKISPILRGKKSI